MCVCVVCVCVCLLVCVCVRAACTHQRIFFFSGPPPVAWWAAVQISPWCRPTAPLHFHQETADSLHRQRRAHKITETLHTQSIKHSTPTKTRQLIPEAIYTRKPLVWCKCYLTSPTCMKFCQYTPKTPHVYGHAVGESCNTKGKTPALF